MYYSQSDISNISGGSGDCGEGGGGGGSSGAAMTAAAAAEVAAAEWRVGATAAMATAFTTSDLMCFQLRYLNFLDCIFHYGLEIIFRNLNN